MIIFLFDFTQFIQILSVEIRQPYNLANRDKILMLLTLSQNLERNDDQYIIHGNYLFGQVELYYSLRIRFDELI